MILEGNYYINGEQVLPNAQGNIIIGLYSNTVLEFIGDLTIEFDDGTVEKYSSVLDDDGNPIEKYLKLYDIFAGHSHKDYNDFESIGSGEKFVEKSSCHAKMTLVFNEAENIADFWMISTVDRFPAFCDETYYGSEDDDIYIYFFAAEGEDPRVIEIDDPTEVQTTEVYACDSLGPKYGTDSEEIPSWQSHTSLDDNVGATFFTEENIDYVAFPNYQLRSAVTCQIKDSDFPHDSFAPYVVDNNTYDSIELRSQLAFVSVDSRYLYYDLHNFDFSSYIGEEIWVGDWHTEIIDAFSQKVEPSDAVAKNFVVTKDCIFPSYGIKQQVDGVNWKDTYYREEIVENRWTSTPQDGLTSLQAMSRVRKYLNIPIREENYEGQLLYTFDIEDES